jgi:hypothetical protein
MAKVVSVVERITPTTVAQRIIDQVVGGYVSPTEAYKAIAILERAIKQIKDDEQFRQLTVDEVAKYGKEGAQLSGGVTLTVKEAGVKYDYSLCGDEQLVQLYETRQALDADIKEREAQLKHLPPSGMADPQTGVIVYPPSKTSKTIVQATFKTK